MGSKSVQSVASVTIEQGRTGRVPWPPVEGFCKCDI